MSILKQLLIPLVLVTGLFANDTLWIDIENSHITWTGRKVAGEHTGTLQLSNGWVIIQNNLIINGKLIFDMKSITNLDVKSPKWRQKLEDHLKNEDFFDIASFPVSSLIVKGSSKHIQEDSEHSHIILSELTIKDVTKDISFPLSIQKNEDVYTAKGIIDIDRTEYGIQYKSGKIFPSLGDKIIEDIFTVQFELRTK